MSRLAIDFTSCYEFLDESGQTTIIVNPNDTPLHIVGESGIARMVDKTTNKPDATFTIGGESSTLTGSRQDGYSLVSYAQQTAEQVRARRLAPEMGIPVFRTLLQTLRDGVPYVEVDSAIDAFQHKSPKGRLR